MAGQKRGIKIGHYRIKPLGIITLAALILIVAAIVVLIVVLGNAPKDAQVTNVASNTVVPTATVGATAEPIATATAAPTATPTPAPRTATIRTLGEIDLENDLLVSVYDSENQTFDFSEMLSLITDSVSSADYTIAQVEGSMGDSMGGYAGTDDNMIIPSAILTALKDSGVDMLTLANDHALDGGFAEEQASVKNVADAGFDYVGASTSAEERSTAVVKDINGIQVGFVAYTEGLNVKEKDQDEAALTYGVNLVSHSNAGADIQAARDAGAEIVVALVNWGDEDSATVTDAQQQIATALANSGADVILGYGPRIIQSISWIDSTSSTGTAKKTLCVYSSGCFLGANRESGYDCGFIFEFTLSEQADGSIAVETPKYIPTYVLRFQNSSEKYQYRAVAIGQWTDDTANNLPDGMAYADLQYMATIWTNMQKYLSEDTAAITRE